jgi:hypothetical protein
MFFLFAQCISVGNLRNSFCICRFCYIYLLYILYCVLYEKSYFYSRVFKKLSNSFYFFAAVCKSGSFLFCGAVGQHVYFVFVVEVFRLDLCYIYYFVGYFRWCLFLFLLLFWLLDMCEIFLLMKYFNLIALKM